MDLFLIIFGVMVLVVAAMSVGVIFSNKPIKGSCGGMSALGMDAACEICGGDKNKCENGTVEVAAEEEEHPAYYDAAKPLKN